MVKKCIKSNNNKIVIIISNKNFFVFFQKTKSYTVYGYADYLHYDFLKNNVVFKNNAKIIKYNTSQYQQIASCIIIYNITSNEYRFKSLK